MNPTRNQKTENELYQALKWKIRADTVALIFTALAAGGHYHFNEADISHSFSGTISANEFATLMASAEMKLQT
jgi:hypothetical protein